MYEFMSRNYNEAKKAEGTDKKIAWVASAAPVELCHAFDVIPLYPENHAAMCGADRMSEELCNAAEAQGFSRDLCSYARIDFGQIATGKSPIGGLPKPDLLLCNNNICGTVTKWYQHLERHFDVPLVFIDAPFQYDGMTTQVIKYVRGQLESALVQFSEITGKPVDRAKFESIWELSVRAADVWYEILTLLKHKPAPINCFDGFIHMGPIVIGRGTQECIDYYEILRDEIIERVEKGTASIPGERFRLGWENLAIWYKIRALSDRFAQHKAALVVSSYTTGFGKRDIPDGITDPIDNMAATYVQGYANTGLKFREKELVEMVGDYSLDGIVMHSNRSCKPQSLGMYDLAKAITEKHDVPVLMLEADHCDPRQFSDEQIFTRIDAFMETLASRKTE